MKKNATHSASILSQGNACSAPSSHNQNKTGLRIKSGIKAGDPGQGTQHNETQCRVQSRARSHQNTGLRIKSGIKAGEDGEGWAPRRPNHNETLLIAR